MRRLLAAGVTWDPGLKPSVEGVAMAARRRKGDWEPWRSGVNWDDMTMGKFGVTRKSVCRRSEKVVGRLAKIWLACRSATGVTAV